MTVYVCPQCGRVLTKESPRWRHWCPICWQDVRPRLQIDEADDSTDQTRMNEEANNHDSM